MQRNAADWYKTLPSRSIHSFKQFTTAFRQRFAASIQQKKVSPDLFSIQQREYEPLRKCVERFNDEIAKIKDLNQGVACLAMLQGTNNEDFRNELLAKAPTVWKL